MIKMKDLEEAARVWSDLMNDIENGYDVEGSIEHYGNIYKWNQKEKRWIYNYVAVTGDMSSFLIDVLSDDNFDDNGNLKL